jgi:hypothetical protein
MKKRLADVTGRRWALWNWYDIRETSGEGRVILRRLRLVQTPLVSVHLHWIKLPDPGRDHHDHPWVFWSWVLRGWYSEEVGPRETVHRAIASRTRVNRAGSLHRVGLREAHRIVEVEPGTLTLVVTGRRRQEWGFWTPTGFVLWSEYQDERAGPDPFDS